MRLAITLDSSWQGQIMGLCGNFDGSAKNDLVGKYGQMETNTLAFGNDWRTDSKCPKVTEPPTNPCTVNKQKKYWAETGCSRLLGDVFAECHDRVCIERVLCKVPDYKGFKLQCNKLDLM